MLLKKARSVVESACIFKQRVGVLRLVVWVTWVMLRQVFMFSMKEPNKYSTITTPIFMLSPNLFFRVTSFVVSTNVSKNRRFSTAKTANSKVNSEKKTERGLVSMLKDGIATILYLKKLKTGLLSFLFVRMILQKNLIATGLAMPKMQLTDCLTQ